ncbi:MAG: hypothetical protein ABR588_08335 [Sphingomicrobium sp.]|nr:hypothetical protein [Sphingomonadales bacterium]
MSRFAPSFRIVLLAGAATVSIGSASSAFAQAATSAADAPAADDKSHVANYIDLSGSLGLATNPRLQQSGSGSSLTGLGRVSAYAVHSVVSERDSLSLSGYVENQSYTNGLRSTQSFDLEGRIRHRANSRLSLYGSAGFSGDVGGQLYNRFLSVPTGPSVIEVGNPLPPVGVIDPNFIAINARTYRLSGQAGLDYGVSARDSLNASIGYDHVFTSRSELDLNYDTVTGSVGWQRQFSERTFGGLRMVVAHSDYGDRGHADVFNPQVTANTQLTEGWSASGSIGVSLVNERTTTVHNHSASLSFDASLCRTTPNETICGRAARATQTSIGQGLVNATSVSVSYFRRLNAKDTIQAGASVARSSGGSGLLIAAPATFYSVNASYNRKISPRLSTGVEAGLRKFDQRGADVPVGGSATVFLRYRLGDLL